MRKDFINNDPYFSNRYLYRTIIDAIRGAKKYIYITTPYYIPDRRLSRVLHLAIQRGVEIKIIIPQKFDVVLIGSGVESNLDKILKSGVKVFRYQPVFIHVKTIVIDGEWVSFGSLNMDNLSIRYNHEANVVTLDKKCVDGITEHFLSDLKQCKELSYQEWSGRPLTAKIREFFIARISWIL